jgi:hypothetical protein
MIRRSILALSLFFFAASCYYSPAMIERAGNGRTTPCREVSRSRCASDQCGGANMDYVTYHCAGSQAVSRCVANFRCSSK